VLIGQCLGFLVRVMSPHVLPSERLSWIGANLTRLLAFAISTASGYLVCSLSSDGTTDSSSHGRCAGFKRSTDVFTFRPFMRTVYKRSLIIRGLSPRAVQCTVAGKVLELHHLAQKRESHLSDADG